MPRRPRPYEGRSRLFLDAESNWKGEVTAWQTGKRCLRSAYSEDLRNLLEVDLKAVLQAWPVGFAEGSSGSGE